MLDEVSEVVIQPARIIAKHEKEGGMNLDAKKNLGLRTAASIFGLFAVVHLLRLFIGFDVVIGTLTIPLWASGVAIILLAALSVWLLKLSNK